MTALIVMQEFDGNLWYRTCQQITEYAHKFIGGRRATRQVVIHMHHLMQRMHFVEQQRQLHIIRNLWVLHTHSIHISLFQALAQIEMIAHGGHPAIDGTSSDRNENPAVGTELAQHMHIFRVAYTALDQSDIARIATLSLIHI